MEPRLKIYPLLTMYSLVQLGVYQTDLEPIEDIKIELQAMHGAWLTKTESQGRLILRCSQACAQNRCKYQVVFQSQFRANRASKQILILLDFNVEHNQECLQEETGAYLMNRFKIIFNQNGILRIMRNNQQKKIVQNPTQIFEEFCVQYDHPRTFLFEGIHSTELRRKLKKKFDNIVAQNRRILMIQKLLAQNRNLQQVWQYKNNNMAQAEKPKKQSQQEYDPKKQKDLDEQQRMMALENGQQVQPGMKLNLRNRRQPANTQAEKQNLNQTNNKQKQEINGQMFKKKANLEMVETKQGQQQQRPSFPKRKTKIIKK